MLIKIPKHILLRLGKRNRRNGKIIIINENNTQKNCRFLAIFGLALQSQIIRDFSSNDTNFENKKNLNNKSYYKESKIFLICCSAKKKKITRYNIL